MKEIEKIDFLNGDAEHLSQFIQRSSIDYLVDVKSSFYYPDQDAFFREAHAVLKDDGLLIMAVPLFRTNADQLHQTMKRYFNVIREEDFTENALRALHLDSDRISRLIDSSYPFGIRSLIK